MLKSTLTSSFLLLILPIISFAASMIEIRDGNGDVSQIYIQGDKARIEMPRKNGLVIMDVKNRTMSVVLHKDRTVLDMSDLLKNNNSGNAQDQGPYIDIYTRSKGLGPELAGYETEEYEIFADNNYCGSVFVSVRALNDIGLRKFASELLNMNQQVQKKITGMTGMQMRQVMDPCNQADRKLADQLQDIGFPMKSIDAGRRLESVVTRIKRNTQLPANAFVIPAGYRQINPVQMMNEAAQQIKRMPPQMQNMMKNMSPEMIEMMKQKMQQFQR